jgi:Zinc finger, C2H2 type
MTWATDSLQNNYNNLNDLNDQNSENYQTIDPALLGPICDCGNASSDHQCPLFSPNVVSLGSVQPTVLMLTFIQERPFSFRLDAFSSYTNHQDIQNVRLYATQDIPPNRSPSPHPLASYLQHNSQINTPSLVERHISETYAPGYVAESDQNEFYSNFPNLTPATTVHSIIEEFLGSSGSFRCKDFLRKGRPNIQLHSRLEDIPYAKEFVKCVNSHEYRASSTSTFGVDSALEGIQRGSHYLIQEYGRMTLTIDQLKVNLRNAKRNSLSPSEIVTANDLRMILNNWGDQSRERFNLGVISPMQGGGDYKFEFYGEHSSPPLRSIWMFYDPGPPDRWSAVIPEFRSPPISYAAAVGQPLPKNNVSRPINNTSFGLLSPSSAQFPAIHSPNPNRTTHRNRSGSLSRASHTSHASHRRALASKHHRTHTPSECGSNYSCDRCQKKYETPSDLKHHQRKYETAEKNHQCGICGRGFLYPKDLTRHINTHLKNKSFPCKFCNKKYTRKDNLQRHLRDDHEDRTPPEPSEPIAPS